MKMLMIVARDSMVSELEELLRGISAYTIINNAMGKGLLVKCMGPFSSLTSIPSFFRFSHPIKPRGQSARLRRFTQHRGNRFPSRCLRSLVKSTCRAMSFLASGRHRRSFKNIGLRALGGKERIKPQVETEMEDAS